MARKESVLVVILSDFRKVWRRAVVLSPRLPEKVTFSAARLTFCYVLVSIVAKEIWFFVAI